MATDIIARGIAAGVVSQVSADRQAVSEDRAAVEAAKTEVLNVAESIPEDYSTLSADVSELKEDLSQIGYTHKQLNFTTGFYIQSGSLNLISNVGYKYSEPFYAKKGSKIFFAARGYMSNVEVLSKSNQDGTVLSHAVTGNSDYIEYSYDVEDSGYFVVCGSVGKSSPIKVQVLYQEDIIKKFDVIAEEISSISANMATYENIQKNFAYAAGVAGIESIRPEYIEGYFIHSGNLTPVSTANYHYSRPFFVKAGYTIVVKANGYNRLVEIIAKTNEDGTVYDHAVKDDGSNEYKEYSYEVTEDGYFAVSGHSVANEPIYVCAYKKIESDNTNYMKMFHKIGVVGDSLSSGELAYTDSDGNHFIDRYDYSWLSNICRDIKSECHHFSRGGLTAKEWLKNTANNGYYEKVAEEENICSAYYIALGTNDLIYSETIYPIGEITDEAGTNTFVGYYKSIINRLHEVNPNAAIFSVSLYTNNASSNEYSDMIEAISELYNYVFYIPFNRNGKYYTSSSSPIANNGHFTTTGYINVADVIESYTNDVIRENKAYFNFYGLNNY